jgi:hypothetical protein
MSRLVMAFLFCLASSIAYAQTHELDWRVINQEWQFIKQETGAPGDLPMPPIIFSTDMPAAARMMFQYPTEENPQDRMIILINPRTMQDYDREMINWGVGHELTHYAMLLQENNWDLEKTTYSQNIRHHCNPKFMRITREVADLIYNIYHDERAKYQMYHQVQRSCVDQPHQ